MPSATRSPYQLKETTSYRREFLEIIDYYIDEGFPDFAKIFIAQLENKLSAIKTYPHGYDQPFPEINVQRANIGKYAIYFTINKTTKEIILLHLFHSRRNIEEIIAQSH